MKYKIGDIVLVCETKCKLVNYSGPLVVTIETIKENKRGYVALSFKETDQVCATLHLIGIVTPLIKELV